MTSLRIRSLCCVIKLSVVDILTEKKDLLVVLCLQDFEKKPFGEEVVRDFNL